MKVLVADASQSIRKRINKLLSTFNKVELIAESECSKDTIDIIRKNLPDVVILDIQFKDGTALDVLKEIAKDAYQPIIIVLTSYDYQTYITEYGQYGVKFFFDKSKDFIKIKDAINYSINAKDNDI